MMCIEIAVQSFFGCKGWMQTKFPVVISLTLKCAFRVIVNRNPISESFIILDWESFGLWIKLLASRNDLTSREITGELVSDATSVRYKTDNVVRSSIAACNMRKRSKTDNVVRSSIAAKKKKKELWVNILYFPINKTT